MRATATRRGPVPTRRAESGSGMSRSIALLPALLLVTAALLSVTACERESRRYQELPAAANRETGVRVSPLEPGMPAPPAEVKSPYQQNAWGMGEGKRLYSAYNCAPCHGVNGGGAIGPPLMDDKWIYGGKADQIYATISQGRPDGMPSFGGHITTQQIWQLVAYVQAMSGQVPVTAAPSRNDDQMTGPPESRQSPQAPVQTGHR
jgi:cytochrome c oxidase cbb3-type subunit 3